ncbi:MAG TPA: CHAT domain-containing protein [Thermoanaerobaculia bacterium]
MSLPEYLDCELSLTAPDQASLTLDGRVYSGRPTLDEAALQRLRASLGPLQYGTELFAALLPPDSDLLSGYREALAVARHEDKLLRLRLRVADTAPAELHTLRWELLYDSRKSITFGCSREIAFSRDCAVPEPPGAAVREVPRLLVAAADPSNLAELGLPAMDRDEARRSIDEALKPLTGLMVWELLDGPVTAARLRDRLVAGGFHALHLQAHGLLLPARATASLVLEAEEGTAEGHKADFVDEESFAQIVEGLRDLRLVTLIACHGGMQSSGAPLSGLGPGLVRRGVPAVVAMRQSISFEAARSFCAYFYSNLARGGTVDRAANEARQQLRLSRRDSDEWGTPVLFMRLRDGLLWEPRTPPAVTAGAGGASTVKWPALLARIQSDNFVPFLGPGVCRGLLPSAAEIAELWASQYDGFPLDGRTDLPAVAQFVETKEGRGFPQDRLPALLTEELLHREQINERKRYEGLRLSEVIDRLAERHFDKDADEPHRLLAGLKISTYATTNFDTFQAAALRWQGKKPKVERCRWREDATTLPPEYETLSGTPQEPLVFHMYGNDEDPTSFVLTEDDHLDFLRAISAEPKLLPLHFKRKLTEAMLLFLGYDVRRLDCRVLLRGLIAHLKDLRRGRIAVLQIDPSEDDAPRTEELRAYMEGCCQELQIEVYWGSVRDFLRELKNRLGDAGGRG